MCACLYKIVHMDHNPVKRWYAAQLSECRSDPSRRHLCIIGNRVAASPLDDLKVACCWTVFQQNYSKYPSVTGSPPSSVVLQDNNGQIQEFLYIYLERAAYTVFECDIAKAQMVLGQTKLS